MFEVPAPPPLKLIKILLLLGESCLQQNEEEFNTDNPKSTPSLKKGLEYANEALDVADTSMSIRSGADARLLKARFLIRTRKSNDPFTDIHALLHWVINHESIAISTEQRDTASVLLAGVSVPTIEEKRQIIEAMGGMNQLAGHWYECPNSHPYFVGECGGVQEESRCLECGARVGGIGYNVALGNNQGAPVLSQELRGRTNRR